LVRTDEQARVRLKRAEDTFIELAAGSELDPSDRRNMQAWRVACCANDSARSAEAEELCRSLLRDFPAHCALLIWALARNWRIDAAVSIQALTERVSLGNGGSLERLTLVGLLHQAKRTDEALSTLAAARTTFEAAKDLELWRFWQTQLLIAAGRLDEAETELAADPAAGSPDTDALIQLARARRTGNHQPYLRLARDIWDEHADPRPLLDACETLARREAWADLSAQQSFLESVGTVASLRLVIASAWHTGRYALCLSLLDRVQSISPGGKLDADLRHLRMACLQCLGRITEVVKQAEATVQEEPQTANVIDLVNALAGKLDIKSAAVQARRLVGRGDLSARSALQVAGLIQFDDSDTARDLWRQAVGGTLSDEEAVVAFHLGNRLGMTVELKPLVERVVRAGQAGGTLVRQVSLDEVAAFIEERRAKAHDLERLYRNAEMPLHFIAGALNVPLVHFYHPLPEGASGRSGRRMLLARWGGRPAVDEYPPTTSDIRLHADVTALLMGAHLGILDDAEATFRPIRIASNTVTALLSILDGVQSDQPARVRAKRQVLELVETGIITVDDDLTTPVWEGIPPNIASTQPPNWLYQLSRAHAAKGLLLDFLPVMDKELRDPIDASPDVAQHLTNCGSLASSLRADGQIDDSELQAATAALGVEGERKGSPVPRRAAVFLRPGTAPLLAQAGLLAKAAGFARLFITSDEHRSIQEDLANEAVRSDTAQWLNAVIDRIRRGLEDGRYEVLPRSSDFLKVRGDHDPCGASLLELLGGSREAGDVFWIDDRAISRQGMQWPAPVLGSFDILGALKHYGAIGDRLYYQRLLQLRRSGIAFVPIESSELLHHLPELDDAAADSETAAQATLRRYFAQALDAEMLRLPPASAPGEPGEHPFVLGAQRAVETALLEIWQSDRSLPDKERASEWLWTSFAIHEATGFPLGSTAPQAQLLHVRLAGLLGTSVSFGFDEGGRKKRQQYLAWLERRIIAPRASADAGVADYLAEVLKQSLINVLLKKDKQTPKEHERVLRATVAELISQFPGPVKVALSHDARLMNALGRDFGGVVSVGQYNFRAQELWRALATAVGGGDTEVQTLDHGPAKVGGATKEDQASAVSFVIGEHSFTLDDPLNEILSESIENRKKVLDRHRMWFDMDNADYGRASAEIATMQESARRMEAVFERRDVSTVLAYGRLRDAIKQHIFRWEDVAPPAVESLLGRFRLRHGGGTWADAFQSAAATLLSEEGVPETLARMSAFPIPLPTPVVDAIDALGDEQREATLLSFVDTARSPIARVHAIRLLARLDRPSARERLEAAIAALAADGLAACGAFCSLLSITWDLLGLTVKDARTRMILAWAHAHEVYSVLCSEGVPDEWISSLKDRHHPRMREIFESEYLAPDVAAPACNDEAALLLFGLSYAVEECVDEVLESVRSPLIEILSTPMPEGGRFPALRLLANRSLFPNRLGSFLVWRPAVERVLGSDLNATITPERLQESIRQDVETIADTPHKLAAWMELYCVLGEAQVGSELQDRVDVACHGLDMSLSSGSSEDLKSWLVALRFACKNRRTASGDAYDEALRGNIEAAAAAVEARAQRAGDTDEVEECVASLLDCCLLAARLDGDPVGSARRFSELVRAVVGKSPSSAATARSICQRVSDDVPVEQGKELWRLLTYLRTFP
jgi:hypothetical protein